MADEAKQGGKQQKAQPESNEVNLKVNPKLPKGVNSVGGYDKDGNYFRLGRNETGKGDKSLLENVDAFGHKLFTENK